MKWIKIKSLRQTPSSFFFFPEAFYFQSAQMCPQALLSGETSGSKPTCSSLLQISLGNGQEVVL